MKDGFEADAEMSDFERVGVFDALRQHSDASPIIVVK